MKANPTFYLYHSIISTIYFSQTADDGKWHSEETRATKQQNEERKKHNNNNNIEWSSRITQKER